MQERPSRARIEDHCANKAGATSGFPFGEEHRVFKVGGKIFAVFGVDGSPAKVTFKTEPELAPLLRDRYPSVRPARPSDEEVTELLDTSHDIVFGSLKKPDREAIEGARER